MNTQRITAILRKAGYKATKVVWQNGRKVTVGDYKVFNPPKQIRSFHNEIAIDCTYCMNKLADIILLMNDNGFEAKEKFVGGGMLQVRKV